MPAMTRARSRSICLLTGPGAGELRHMTYVLFALDAKAVATGAGARLRMPGTGPVPAACLPAAPGLYARDGARIW